MEWPSPQYFLQNDRLGGLMVCGPVKQKTLKLVFIASILGTQKVSSMNVKDQLVQS